jgi:molybdopterin/thiamine biosynthesis adenylyltransferase/rhodanese-related sulfurtransferase
VLIVGLGGLGSPAALYLAGAGIGTLGLMDSDSVEVSNLHRQIVHSEAAAAAGCSKVASALESCRALNSSVEYLPYETRASPEQFLRVLSEGNFDLVLDCTDNPATRYLISDACVVAGCVLVSGAAQRGDGQVVVLNCPPVSRELRRDSASGSGSGDLTVAGAQVEVEEKGPCYRCVFPRPPAPEMVRGCSEIGILGHVVGVIGVLMAGEAVKIISQGKHLPRPSSRFDPSSPSVPLNQTTNSEVNGTSQQQQEQQSGHHHRHHDQSKAKPKQQHTMLLYNTFASDPRHQFRTIILRGRRKDCLACGDDEVLASKGLTRITAETISQGRMDYVAFCGVLEDVKVLGEENRIDAKEFLNLQHHEREKRHRHRHNKRGGGHPPDGRKKRPLVVDVREEHEVELGPKVKGSVNIPLSRILRHGGRAFDDLQAHTRLDTNVLYDDTNDHGEGRRGGMVDQETHVPVTHANLGGTIDQESHIPVVQGSAAPMDGGSMRGGGMVDQESHIPFVSRGSDAYPQRPLAQQGENGSGDDRRGDKELERGGEEEDEDADDGQNAGWPVYFVCQRGNDSQIAAQKLLERIQEEKEESTPSTNRSQWGWVGDVKGGFMAMERHQFGESS